MNEMQWKYLFTFSESFFKLIVIPVSIFVATKQFLIFTYLFSSFRCFPCLKSTISTAVSVIKRKMLLTSSTSRGAVKYFKFHESFHFFIFPLLIILCVMNDLFYFINLCNINLNTTITKDQYLRTNIFIIHFYYCYHFYYFSFNI